MVHQVAGDGGAAGAVVEVDAPRARLAEVVRSLGVVAESDGVAHPVVHDPRAGVVHEAAAVDGSGVLHLQVHVADAVAVDREEASGVEDAAAGHVVHQVARHARALPGNVHSEAVPVQEPGVVDVVVLHHVAVAGVGGVSARVAARYGDAVGAHVPDVAVAHG